MPDLNLIDEGGFEDITAPVAAPPAKKKTSSSSGGGVGKTILILLLVLILCAIGVFFLNQRGIINLWGNKKPIVAQIQDEPFPQEPTQQSSQEQLTQTQNDTMVTLLETPPGEETLENATEPESKATKQSANKSKVRKEKAEVIETELSSKLSEMHGEFTIQVIAYKEKKQAVETSDNLEIAGYPSFVEKVPMKGGDWYTVRIGRYASPEEAKKAVKTFAEQLQAHYVIDKIRTK